MATVGQLSLFDPPPDMPVAPAPQPPTPSPAPPLPVVARDRLSLSLLEDYVAGVR